MPHEISLQKIQRHNKLWMDDGNVVLVVEDIGFRVHRGVLAGHSEVFRDMFSLPQPSEAYQERLDGCTVVRIPHENADAVAFVLNVIYHDEGVTKYVFGFIVAGIELHIDTLFS